jgi:hypothetical protein
MSEEEGRGGEEEDEGINLLEEKDYNPKKRSHEEEEIRNIVRPGFEATENTSYYNLASLYVLIYAHIKEGVSVPSLFAPQSVSNVKFDF